MRATLTSLMTATGRGGGRRWTPKQLFASGETGAWYDPSDLSTMFEDSAGSTPVTASGQDVGLIMDKSGAGNNATIASAKPVYTASGPDRYLAFNGVDDSLVASGALGVFSAVTLAARFSVGATGGVDVLTIRTGPPGDRYIGMNLFGVTPYPLTIRLGNASIASRGTSGLGVGTLHTVIATWDKAANTGHPHIFVDGVEVTYSVEGAITTDLGASGANIQIGAPTAYEGVKPFSIYKALVINRAITNSERMRLESFFVASGSIANALLDESGNYVLTEAGEYMVLE